MAQSHFLIHRDGKNYGPYTPVQARDYLVSGDLEPGDLAWDEAAKDWIPLTEMLLRLAAAPVPKRPPRPRKMSRLVALAIAWWLVLMAMLFSAGIFFAGVIISYVNPSNHDTAAAIALKFSAAPIVIISLALTIWLTAIGKLPGTEK